MIIDRRASDTEFPESRRYQKKTGFRTILTAPLLREGLPLGGIDIRTNGGASFFRQAHKAS